MKASFGFSPTPARLRTIAGASAAGAQRAIALVLMWLMIPLGMGNIAWGQQQAPPPPPDQQDQGPPPDDQGPPPQQWNALSPDQLNQLVAPIALYPDSLVAQVLAAATYPTQIVDADRFVQSQAGAPPEQIAEEANNQPWDPSVKALCAFPSVLANMDKNLDWTSQLGNAYYNQPQDVMSAVQAMRQQAYQRGDLRSSDQLNVEYQPSQIVIEPANPAVVYVPYYDPWVIWGFRPYYAWYAPPPPPGWRVGVHFGFGIGVAVGAWGGWGWGWGHWGFAWGPHPMVMYNHVTFVSRSVTVVNHGYYGRFDRNPGARAYNMHAAAQVRNVSYTHVTEVNNNRTVINNRTNFNNNVNRTNNFNRTNNYNRPAQNYNRPAQNYNRPAQNYNRPAQNYNRPAQNYNRPAQQPRNEGRPNNEKPHNEGHPQNHGGGDHEKPHGR